MTEKIYNATHKEHGLRADVVVTAYGNAFEQVHVIDGTETGKLLHSATFPAFNLSHAVYSSQDKLEEYTRVMLASVRSETERKLVKA